jgi:hypothetical protein
LEDLQLDGRDGMYGLLTAEHKTLLKDMRDIKDGGTDDKKADTKDEKKP